MSHYSSDKASKYQFESLSSKLARFESPVSRHHPPHSSLVRHLSPSTQDFHSYHHAKQSPGKANTPDFFSILTQHMRRIDDDFKVQWSDETPLQQALNALISAIDIIENVKTAEYNPDDEEQEALETNEKLLHYENLLRSKEEKLKAEEAICLREKQLLSAEKEKIKKLKEHCLKLENELKSQKDEHEKRSKEETAKTLSMRNRLEKELQHIEEQKVYLDRETREIELIKNKLEDFNTNLSAEREELELERTGLFEKGLELEKERWQLENEKAALEEKAIINGHMKEKIAEELETIETERTNLLKLKIDNESSNFRSPDSSKTIDQERLYLHELQNTALLEKLQLAEDRENLMMQEERIAQILLDLESEKNKVMIERNNIELDKQAVLEEREAVDEAWDEIEEKQGSQTGGKKVKAEDDYSQMLEELQNQMMSYNKEVEIREREIELKNFALMEREEELDNKLAEIQAVEYSLLRAKQDLEELSLGTIPELESQSQGIQKILADLLQKRNEVDTGYSHLQSRIDEFEKSKSGRNSRSIERLADELEMKLKKVKEREDELTLVESALEREKKENFTHALFLQKAQKENERKEIEILEAKKKLEMLQNKLETAIVLINSKESSLITMKDSIMVEKNKLAADLGNN